MYQRLNFLEYSDFKPIIIYINDLLGGNIPSIYKLLPKLITVEILSSGRLLTLLLMLGKKNINI